MGTQRRGLWAVVLAGGEGRRLSALTLDRNGHPVPKQFCSLNGGPALIHEAIERAGRIVPREQTCVVVTRAHARYWRELLWPIPRWNVLVEPLNRGTAHAVLHAALEIAKRDRHARVLFLPADHFVQDEELLAASMRSATAFVESHPDRLCLLGIEPDRDDRELGYIVPSERTEDAARHVARFVEKPPADMARALIAAGAMWNSFIFSTTVQALLQLLRRTLPDASEEMQQILSQERLPASAATSLEDLYDRLGVVDLSTSVIQGAEAALRVIAAERFGWSDLGTPDRVREVLRRIAPRPAVSRPGLIAASHSQSVDLATNFHQFARGS
jgi:mannose-1-phosphate guanylyltransferase